MTDYRIEYTIQRRQPGDDDFTEIGFGQSGSWEEIDAAIYAVSTDLETRQWETSDGMPDPGSVDRKD
jgi:hypothetical protein